MFDSIDGNLFAVSIDEDSEKRMRQSDTYSFESEFAFDESQIVKFPVSMGINGFAFLRNSVNFLNSGNGLDGPKKVFPNIYAIGQKILPITEQKNCGRILCDDYPFN